ncbi:hypothetical protein [Cytobacillus citreus]|nr:hypothetical protein [Cytobacillus citreus]
MVKRTSDIEKWIKQGKGSDVGEEYRFRKYHILKGKILSESLS